MTLNAGSVHEEGAAGTRPGSLAHICWAWSSSGNVCPEVGPGKDVPCTDCGEPMPHTAISQTERGVVCVMCQARAKLVESTGGSP